MIDAILLQAAAAMVEELQERLGHSFKVRMVTDIFMEWEEIECKDWPDGKADVLSSWKIENVDERNKKASLPAPAPHTKYDRVSRQLKKAGHSKITIGVAERFHALLQKHRPEMFPPAPATPTEQTTTAVLADEKIVPFRKPYGSDGPGNGGPLTAA